MLRISNNFKKLCLVLLVFILVVNFFNIQTFAEVTETKPDLIISLLSPPKDFYEEKTVKIVVKIKNQGDKNISSGTIIKLGLYLDSTLLFTNSSNNGLSKGKELFINLSWTPIFTDGKQKQFTVWVNYDNSISESNYNNNFNSFNRVILERATDLEIIDVDLPEIFEVNETSTIIATVKNTGTKTSSSINVSLSSSVEGLIKSVLLNDFISRDESYKFYFNWTPKKFGLHKITLKVIYKNTINDTFEDFISVGIQNFEWWNNSWHYRYFLSSNGKGIAKHVFNFTELLTNIGVVSKEFENNKLRIIRYSDTGQATQMVDNFWFDENDDFNPTYNANGTLIWDIGSSTAFRYYCIYFDASSNFGDRTSLDENEGLTSSAYGTLNDLDFVEGWWATVASPKKDSYTSINDPIDILVNTSAKADTVKAFIFMNENVSHSYTIDLSHTGEKIDWYYNDFYFDRDGNWTIQVNATDAAGYRSDIVERNIFVGKPDFSLVNISLSDFYNAVNITFKIYCENASVEDVPVFFRINKTSNNSEIYNTTIIVDLEKNKNNIFNYEWVSNSTGKHDITMIVDPENNFIESNEKNNKLSKTFIIYETPDLEIEEINLPYFAPYEFENVKIEVKIKNNALGDANNYTLVLYIEPESQGIMKYISEKNSKNISVKMDSSIATSLYWTNARSGRWLVGVQILFNDSKKDSNFFNNRMLCEDILIVKSYEKNKPVIGDILINKGTGKQGEKVTIKSVITDDSGIELVNITIKNPSGVSITDSMMRSPGNTFEYEYLDAKKIGTYNVEIFVVDISYYSNNASKSTNFSITRETTDPVISYFGAKPNVQLKDESVEIVCTATDNIGIELVEVTITPPNNISYVKFLSEETDSQYIYKNIYNVTGRYVFSIIVTDEAGNIALSGDKEFWITLDTEDRDNDGMPDYWEKRYNFDPEDPNDAEEDFDKDGITNVEEYQGNINPIKDISMQNIGYRIKMNLGYIAVAVIFFILILLFSLYGIRRRF